MPVYRALMSVLRPGCVAFAQARGWRFRFYNIRGKKRAIKERRRDMMELDIQALDMQGRGFVKLGACTHIVAGALPGERVRVDKPYGARSHQVWELQAILRASSQRVQPPCPHFGTCGGCVMQHLEPAAQVAVKQRFLEDSLQRIAGLVPERVLATMHGPYWGYRHRGRLSVYQVPGYGVRIGFREHNGTHVADLRQCRVVAPVLSALLEPLRLLIERLSIAHRIPKIEFALGDTTCVLVLRHLLPLNESDKEQLRAFGQTYRVQWWTQPGGPDSASPLEPVREAQNLAYALPEFDLRFEYRPTDFTQVNPGSNRKLVVQALGLLAPGPDEHVLDLFCGLGNFTLPLARQAASVVGVEGSPALLERAGAAARAHHLQDRVRFAARNLFQVDEDWWRSLGPIDKVLMDPPREGARAVSEILASLPEKERPRRIVYVSCEPRTLARDAAILAHRGAYRLRAAGVLNLFPHTAHVESMAVFEPV